MRRKVFIIEQTLLIEDLSSVGSVSLSIAMPIMTAFGEQPAIMPSMILSTHTGGFGQPATISMAKNLPRFIDHWHKANVTFSSVLIGYLGNELEVYEEISSFLKEDPMKLVLLDPAFADHGKLYSGMSTAVVTSYLKLCQNAQILLPNLTETCFLLEQNVSDTINRHYLTSILKRLSQKTGIDNVAITGIELDNQIGTAFLTADEFHYVSSEKVAGDFFGTGDLFSSLVLGFLLNKETFQTALKLANKWTSEAVLETAKQGQRDSRMGITLSSVLSNILAYKGN